MHLALRVTVLVFYVSIRGEGLETNPRVQGLLSRFMTKSARKAGVFGDIVSSSSRNLMQNRPEMRINHCVTGD